MAGRHRQLAVALGLAAAMAGCAASATSSSTSAAASSEASPAADSIPISVDRPAGPGPFPTIVILHDCSGLGPRSSGAPARWSHELVSRGYVVVIPDSFSTRGRPNGVCTDASPGRADVSPLRRAGDAYVALAHARSLPYVDGRRVGLMGGSHGGTTTLQAVSAPEDPADPLAAEKRAGFLAAVALYPSCRGPLGRWRDGGTGAYRAVTPLLILIGDRDDWTPAEPCRRLVASTVGSELPVAIRVYPGAHHSFDSDRPVRYVATRVNRNAPSGRGATTGGDPDAWADSITRVAEFFAVHLK
jgi:dienelactone hydrolase